MSPAARVLGLDVGKRRIGAALAEGGPGAVTGLETILRRTLREDVERLAALAARLGATRVVVGLPLHMDGSESPMAKEARRVAGRLAAACALPVEMHDERLTSVEAEQRLAARGWSLKRLLAEKKRGAVDRLAAQILLEDWLGKRPEGAR